MHNIKKRKEKERKKEKKKKAASWNGVTKRSLSQNVRKFSRITNDQFPYSASGEPPGTNCI